MADVTTLLGAARAGQKRALDQLYQLLYQDLRRIARIQLRRHSHGQLEATTLVNECYLRLAGRAELRPQDRQHFLAYAASAMRSAIVDLARQRLAEKRGGGLDFITLRTELDVAAPDEFADVEVLRIHAALEDLAEIDARIARLVEMRFFGGMSELGAAEALGVSKRTAQRDWEKARLFLRARLASK